MCILKDIFICYTIYPLKTSLFCNICFKWRIYSLLILFFNLFTILDVYSLTRAKESSEAAPTAAEPLSCSICPAFSSDLQVLSSWESNEGPEPQLTLQGEVFTFKPQPHSPKPGQVQGNQEMTGMGDDQLRNQNVRRYEAQLEDDFIGSESDEVRVPSGRGTGTLRFKCIHVVQCVDLTLMTISLSIH